VGWGIVAWRRDGAILVSVIAAGCLVAGVAAILSVGIVLLAAGVVLAVRVAQSIPLRPADRPLPVRALAAAVLLAGLGTLLAAFVAATQPIVDCSGQGSTSGHETTDGRTYTWRCEDGRLVEFERS
jgi:hypothetical protein